MICICISTIILATSCSAFQTFHAPSRSTTLYYYGSYDDEKRKGPDFYGSYDDENDFHIPNRIGYIAGKNWGKEEDAADAVSMLAEAGVSFVSCESKRAEGILGRAMEDEDYEVTVACSYNARFKAGSGESFLVNSVEDSLQELSKSSIKLVQARPSRLSLVRKNAIADGMLDCIDDGNCDYVGTIGLKPSKLRSMLQKMERRDDTVTTNQFEFSIGDRKNEKWIQHCKDLGVTPLIRNPLGKDLISSGLWTLSDPSYKGWRRFSQKQLEKYDEMHSVLFRIADMAYGRSTHQLPTSKKNKREKQLKVTPAQVAINYIIAKGGVPLVDVYNEESALDLIGCLGWKLTDDEVEMLEIATEL